MSRIAVPPPMACAVASRGAVHSAFVLLLAASAAIPARVAGGVANPRGAEYPAESPTIAERVAAPGRVFLVDGLQAVVLDTAWASSTPAASDLPWLLQGFEGLGASRWEIESGWGHVAGLLGNEIGDAHLQELESDGRPSNRMPVLRGEAILRRSADLGEAQMRVVFDQNDEFSARTESYRSTRSGSTEPGERSWFGENTPFRSALGGGILVRRGDESLQADARSGWWWTTSPASGDLVPWRGTEGAASLGTGAVRFRGSWMDWRTAGGGRQGRWAVGDAGVEARGQGGRLEWMGSLAARSRDLSGPDLFLGEERTITFPAALSLSARAGERPPRRAAETVAADRRLAPEEGGDVAGQGQRPATRSLSTMGGPGLAEDPRRRCAAGCLEARVEAMHEGGFVEVRPRLAGEAALADGMLLWSAAAFLRRGRQIPEAWEVLAPLSGSVALLAEMAPDERRLGGDLAIGYRMEAGAFASELGTGLAWEDGAPFFAADSFFADVQGLPLRAGRWKSARPYVAPRGRIEARYAPSPAWSIFAAASVRDALGGGARQLDHMPARTLSTWGLRGRLPSDLAYEAAISRVGEKIVRGWLADGADFRMPAHWEGRVGLAQPALGGRLQLSLSALNAFGREFLEHPRGNEIRFRILVAARYAI